LFVLRVQGQMMQMSMMVPPDFPKELNALNKDEKLLRWMLIKSRGSNWAKVTKET
jgi:small subunit ribosomal protein S6